MRYHRPDNHLLARSVRQMHAVTDMGISKASALIYSSTWAAQSAIKDYHAEPQKVHVVPMGANFDDPPGREIVWCKKKSAICKLLFVGVDWLRKGGEIAFETLLALHHMGIPAELVICGCVPPKHFTHPNMKVIPYLDKNDPAQYNEMTQLYREADFYCYRLAMSVSVLCFARPMLLVYQRLRPRRGVYQRWSETVKMALSCH